VRFVRLLSKCLMGDDLIYLFIVVLLSLSLFLKNNHHVPAILPWCTIYPLVANTTTSTYTTTTYTIIAKTYVLLVLLLLAASQPVIIIIIIIIYIIIIIIEHEKLASVAK
jgi:hypothetical protein